MAAAAGRTRHHGGNPPAGGLTLRFPTAGVDAGRAARRAYFSRGEVTPFQLRIDAATGINVDARATASRWRRGAAMKREAGMTLIEVMVALVIFALAGWR